MPTIETETRAINPLNCSHVPHIQALVAALTLPQIPAEYLQGHLAGLIGEAICDETVIKAPQWQEAEAELQVDLAERIAKAKRSNPRGGQQGGFQSYTCPEPKEIAVRRYNKRKRRDISMVSTAVESLSDLELATRLVWVHKHRGRGLSPRDLEIQREWCEARCAGAPWVGSLNNLELPQMYHHLVDPVDTLGRRRAAPERRKALRLLMLMDHYGWAGLWLSGIEANDWAGISTASWWRAMAWLELHGFTRRVRITSPTRTVRARSTSPGTSMCPGQH